MRIPAEYRDHVDSDLAWNPPDAWETLWNWATQEGGGGICLLLGNFGTGKSQMTWNAMWRLWKSGVLTSRWLWKEIVDRKNAYVADRELDDPMPELYRKAFLCIDEAHIGGRDARGELTVASTELLNTIIGKRHEERRATLLVANLTEKDMRAWIGQRLWDRVMDTRGAIIELHGDSRRGQ